MTSPESQIPLFNDVDEVTLADSGRLVLVSFKDEVSYLHATRARYTHLLCH